MANVVVMPQAGQTMETGTITVWHKKAGSSVREGDLLAEVETEKAVVEIESFYTGVIVCCLVPEGVEVPVLSPIAIISQVGEEVDVEAVLEAHSQSEAAKKQWHDET